MKKLNSICICLISLCLVACSNYEPSTSDSHFVQTVENENIKSSDMKKNEKTDADISLPNVNNDFYFSNDETEFSLDGGMYFNDWGDVYLPKDYNHVDFEINNTYKDENGFLSHIVIKQFDEYKIPENRLSIGWFYVEKNKITRLVDDRENPWNLKETSIDDFLNNGTLPKYSMIVCQNKKIKNNLSPKYKKGWHTFLKVSGKVRQFGFYYYPETDKNKGPYYWEHFYWEKGKGLVGYDCGYKAGVDYFELGVTDN